MVSENLLITVGKAIIKGKLHIGSGDADIFKTTVVPGEQRGDLPAMPIGSDQFGDAGKKAGGKLDWRHGNAARNRMRNV